MRFARPPPGGVRNATARSVRVSTNRAAFSFRGSNVTTLAIGRETVDARSTYFGRSVTRPSDLKRHDATTTLDFLMWTNQKVTNTDSHSNRREIPRVRISRRAIGAHMRIHRNHSYNR